MLNKHVSLIISTVMFSSYLFFSSEFSKLLLILYSEFLKNLKHHFTLQKFHLTILYFSHVST